MPTFPERNREAALQLVLQLNRSVRQVPCRRLDSIDNPVETRTWLALDHVEW